MLTVHKKPSIVSRTSANGNCLYNAASLAVIGSERLSLYLRGLTSIELYLEFSFYSSHPLIEERFEAGAFHSWKNAFAMCLSDEALGFTRGVMHLQQFKRKPG